MNILKIDNSADSFSIPFKTMMEIIAAVEKNFDVNSVKYGDLLMWPAIRLTLWTQLSHPSKNRTRRTKNGPLKLPRIHLDEASIASLQRCEKPDLLFLSTPGEHSTQIQNRFYGRQTDPIIEMARKFYNVLKIEPVGEQTKKTLPRFEPTTFINTITTRENTTSQGYIENFPALQEVIKNICGVIIEEDFIIQRALEIKGWQEFFSKLLSVLSPKAVVIMCTCRDLAMGLIWACRKISIPTVDIQHGKQGKYNGVYTHWTKLPAQGYDLLPEIFWSWGAKSKENIEKWFPENHQRHRSIIGGNRWLGKWVEDENFGIDENLKPFYNGLRQIERSILFSLQPIGDKSSFPEHVIKAMRCSPANWVWLLRLHPLYSSKEHKDHIKKIMQQNGIDNYEIDSATDCPLYALLKFCDHHITAWSSVCYEALIFGVPTTLVHREGWELYDSYIQQGLFNRAGNADELIACISRSYAAGQFKENVPYIETDRQYGEKAIGSILGYSGETPRHIDRKDKYNQTKNIIDDRTTAEQFFKSGFYSFREGNLKKAMSSFENAIACCPVMPELHFALATVHAQSGDLYAAREACEMELKMYPGQEAAKGLLKKIKDTINAYDTKTYPQTNQSPANVSHGCESNVSACSGNCVLIENDSRLDTITLTEPTTSSDTDMKLVEVKKNLNDNIFAYTKRVSIELSNLCNYANIHKKCPLNLESQRIILSKKIVEKVIDSMARYGFKGTIAFHTYNEPMMDPRLFLFIQYARQKCPECEVMIMSNGYYFNQTMADELVDIGVGSIYVTAYTPKEQKRLGSIHVDIPYSIQNYELDDRLNLYDRELPANPNVEPCHAPLEEIIVTRKGQVSLCCLDWKRKHCFGNLYDETLEDVILQSDISKVYSMLSSGHRNFAICKSCGWSR